MEQRTYRASTTQLAIEQVQRELGPEAIILSVRQVPGGAPWQAWKNPEVEVIAIPMPSLMPVNPTEKEKQTKTNPSKGDVDLLMTQITTQLAHTYPKPAPKTSTAPVKYQKPTSDTALPDALLNIRRILVEQGIDNQLIKVILTTCGDTLSLPTLEDETRLRNHVKHQIEAHIHVQKDDPVSNANLENKKTICLVGMSGTGKTSTCAKLMAHYQQHCNKKVAWICTDTVRTGAINIARTYTEAFNIPLYVAYTPDELTSITQEMDTEIIVVDTPACNPYHDQDLIRLGSYLTILSHPYTYLTVPATVKDADMKQALAAFGALNLSGLIITKLDETRYLGSAINLAWKSQLPLAHLTNGTHLIDDLYPVDAKKLAGLLFGERLKR